MTRSTLTLLRLVVAVFFTALVAALVAVPAMAWPHPSPAVDPGAAFQVTGTVVEVEAGFGAGMPTIVVDDPALGVQTLGLAPIWFLTEVDFVAAVGDEITLLAYPCSRCWVEAVVATLENLTAGGSFTFRDDDGTPLWADGHPGGWSHPACDPGDGSSAGVPATQHSMHGGGPGSGGPGEGMGPGGSPFHGDGPFGGQCDRTGPDLGSAFSVWGTVSSITAGTQGALLVLSTGDGDLEILLMPYWPLAAAGLLIEEGMELEADVAPWNRTDGVWLLALAITDPVTGVTIQLRDPETGFPVAGGPGMGPW